jgi:hypothetical protein
MTVPEAAMDEDDFAMAWHNNIGLAGQVLPMETEPESLAVKDRADYSLWLCIFAANSRHQCRARFFRDSVHRLISAMIRPTVISAPLKALKPQPRLL